VGGVVGSSSRSPNLRNLRPLSRQSKLGTTRVPYSATWVKVTKSRLSKFKRSLEGLNDRMIRLPPGAAGAGRAPGGGGGGGARGGGNGDGGGAHALEGRGEASVLGMSPSQAAALLAESTLSKVAANP